MKILSFILFTFYFSFSQVGYSQTITDSTDFQSKAVVRFPEVIDYANDNENILMTHEKAILNKILENFEKNYNHKIIIVTISSIYPYDDIFKYSLDMANTSVSEKQTGAEILIVLSQNLKQIQIQNSDSIKNLLTDDETKNILETAIIPELKKGNYFEGLKAGISKIKDELK